MSYWQPFCQNFSCCMRLKFCAVAAPASAAGMLRPGEERRSHTADAGTELNVVVLRGFPQLRADVATDGTSGTNEDLKGAISV